MNPRLLILLAVAAVMAVLLAQKMSKPQAKAETEEIVDTFLPPDGQDGWDPDTQKLLADRQLRGREPSEPAEFDLQVAVNETSAKTRLDFTLSESHGYYAETFRVEFWYKDSPDMGPDESPMRRIHYENNFVKAKETLSFCFEVVPAELMHVGGEMGTTENWEARVVDYGRARVENPSPLPALSNTRNCD